MLVIKIIADAFGDTEWAGYLQKYDTSNPDEHGYGRLSVTPDIRMAMKFVDLIEATTFWKQQSTSVPYRPDGKPNRPLTSFTITFETVKIANYAGTN